MTEAQKHKSVCDSKLDFTTINAVKEHIANINKVGILDFYKCKICINYHTYTIEGKTIISEKREYIRHKRETTENRIKKLR
jgi:hypothetical protein